MNNQQSFSHGLLYSVSPHDFYSLHLNEEDSTGDFDWQEYESQNEERSLLFFTFHILKSSAVKWGVGFIDD